MDNNPIGELMQTTMENVKNILKVDTVVGDPIYTPDGITLVPISKISVGFGGGGVEFNSKTADNSAFQFVTGFNSSQAFMFYVKAPLSTENTLICCPSSRISA